MEKYGVVPPRFTKAWFAHYWFYYKFHVIAVAVALIIVGSTVRSCVTAVDYDLQVQYLGDVIPADEALGQLKEKISQLSGDATGNGKVETDVFTQVTMGDGAENAQYNYAISMKITAELETGENGIYIMSKAFAEQLSQYECFMNVSDWAKDYPEDALLDSGVLSLAGNKMFAEMGFDTDNLYIGVLKLYDRKKDKKHMTEKHENAVNTANLLIK